jgi:hypothetical protein
MRESRFVAVHVSNRGILKDAPTICVNIFRKIVLDQNLVTPINASKMFGYFNRSTFPRARP